MPKAALTFELLASTLVMLVIMPFLNQNNSFSNVNAQEYGSFDYDVDDRYSQYPTEENKYECQTGPLEGFFVSSVEFCKHVKFDKEDRNDHRDNNQTGTHGPQSPPGPQGPTGPAGGQIVPTGPPGPPGVPGPQGERGLTGATGMTGAASTVPGPQGAMGFNGTDGMNGTQGPRGFNGTDGVNGTQGLPGPSGITQLNDTNTYLVTTEEVFNNRTSSNIGQAFCDPGDFVINGGFTITSIGVIAGSLSGTEESFNRPILIPYASGW